MPQQAQSVTANAEQVQVQAEQMRAQAENMREQARQMREQAQAMRDAGRGLRESRIIVTPDGARYASRRKEAMTFVGFLVVVMAAVAILRPLFRSIGRRLEGAPRPAELAGGASADRLERIEQAVEAMAIEIERISEGQRFTTRLLAERKPEAVPFER